MKVTFFVLFILIISSIKTISNEAEGRSLIQINEQGKELNGNLNGNGSIEVSTSLNNKNATVASKNDMLKASSRGGRKGGGGGGGGKKGRGSGKGGGGAGVVGGGVAGGVIGGGIVGGCPPFTYCYCPPFTFCPPYWYGYGHRYGPYNSTTTSSAGPYICVSTFVLCLSFLALITLFHTH